MRNERIILLLFFIFFAGVVAGCIQKPQPTATPTPTPTAGYPVTIIDSAGREVTLSKPPERVIVITSYWAEIIHCLGLDDKIVGVGKYIPHDQHLPKEVREKPAVGSVFHSLNWETVVSLKPDLIITDWYGGKYKDKEIIKKAEELKIPVIALTAKNVDDNVKAVRLLGKVFGKEEKAEEVARWMEERLQKVKEIAIPADKKKNVLLVSASKGISGPVTVYARGSAWASMVELVGAHNLAFDKKFSTQWPKLDLEKIIAYWGNDTDVLLLTSFDEEKLEKAVNDIKNDTRWQAIKAVREGHVYGILAGSKGYLDWGPRIVVGIYEMGGLIYPEYYPDWKPIAKELLERFYGEKLPSPEYKTVVDSFGREIRIPSQNVKAVILMPDYEIITYALGAYDHAIGVGKYHKHNPILKALTKKGKIPKDLPNLGSLWSGVNLEEVVKLKPDCIIVWAYGETGLEKVEKIEEKTGIPVIAIDLRSLDDFYNAIELLGKVFNKEEKAEAIVKEVKKEIDFVVSRTSKVPADKRVRTFLMYGVKGQEITTEGKGGINIQLLKLVNTIPVTENFSQKYPHLSLEQLYKLNPDVILLFYMYKKEPSPEAIYSDPAWKDLKAVKNRRICDLRGYYEEGWGGWNPAGIPLRVLAFAKCAYPELFEDVNFTAKADELFREFYGISYRDVVGVRG